MWRAIAAGGSTIVSAVSAGNAARCLERALISHGLDLSKEFVDAEPFPIEVPDWPAETGISHDY